MTDAAFETDLILQINRKLRVDFVQEAVEAS